MDSVIKLKNIPQQLANYLRVILISHIDIYYYHVYEVNKSKINIDYVKDRIEKIIPFDQEALKQSEHFKEHKKIKSKNGLILSQDIFENCIHDIVVFTTDKELTIEFKYEIKKSNGEKDGRFKILHVKDYDYYKIDDFKSNCEMCIESYIKYTPKTLLKIAIKKAILKIKEYKTQVNNKIIENIYPSFANIVSVYSLKYSKNPITFNRITYLEDSIEFLVDEKKELEKIFDLIIKDLEKLDVE